MYYFVGKIHITCEEREKAPGEAGGRRDGDENDGEEKRYSEGV